MTGCVKDAPPPPLKPVVVDLAPIRCGDTAAADRAELKRFTPRPAPPVTKAATRMWIDTLELSERRKSAAGLRAVDELAACRTGSK
jgi:hypothetical protein